MCSMRTLATCDDMPAKVSANSSPPSRYGTEPEIRSSQNLRERRQEAIAGHVAVSVVEHLELSSTSSQRRSSPPIPCRRLVDAARDALLIRAMVPQTGEVVGERCLLEAIPAPL